MATELEAEFHEYLLHNEKILWTGKPGAGIRFRGADTFLIPFSILWLAFALYWEFTVFLQGGDWFFKLFGAGFFAIGATFMIGRFFIDAYARKNQSYAITNMRIIIRQKRSINSFDIDALPNLLVDSGGTINFLSMKLFDFNPRDVRQGFGIWSPSILMSSLEFLENPQEVYKLILNLQRDAKAI